MDNNLTPDLCYAQTLGLLDYDGSSNVFICFFGAVFHSGVTLRSLGSLVYHQASC